MTKFLNFIILLWSLIIVQKLSGQQLHRDTTFLLKKGDHSIFIDRSPTSKFYDHVSDFRFGKFDGDSYNYSLQYLKDNGIKLTRNRITDLPKKWVILKYYKNKFYVYHPSDFYSHFKAAITDTSFIDFGGEGPMANKIISYKKINEKTFSFSLTGVERPKRNLTIHFVDKTNGIAIFEELYNDKEKLYYLMIDAAKIRKLPIIVNYCKSQKQMEFDFEEPDYKKLLKLK